MTLSLSDLGQLEATSRLLLNPFVSPDPDAWLSEAARAMGEMLGSDAALIMPPVTPGSPYRSHSINDDRVSDLSARLITGITDSGLTFHDPVLGACYQSRAPHTAITRDVFRHVVEPLGYRMEDSLFVSEVVVPLGYDNWVSMHEQTPSGDASLVSFARRGREMRFGSAVGDVLQTLMPSFRSGLDTLARFGAQRSALDAVTEPLAVFSPDGMEIHRNTALGTVFGADPERIRLGAHLSALGQRLGRHARPATERPTGDGPLPAAEVVQTGRGCYVLRPALLPPGVFGPEPTAMVSVEASVPPALPDAATLRERLGLTRREAEVALLLADGLTNAALAERLFVSPHTARHHVESVLAKLGLTSRAAVASRLTQAA